jgi:DNA-binding winged helix-turn-helix (wHTH) protein
VFDALVVATRAVVPEATLLRRVWDGSGDEHAVEVTVARLRRRLGPAGAALCTVPRRGYRLT